jgi:hypothetical protein
MVKRQNIARFHIQASGLSMLTLSVCGPVAPPIPNIPGAALKGLLRSPVAGFPQSQMRACFDSNAFLTGRIDWMTRLREANRGKEVSIKDVFGLCHHGSAPTHGFVYPM